MANLRKGIACRLNSIWEQNTKRELKETGWKALDRFHLVRPGTSGDSHEHSNEHLCSKRGREFLNCLRTVQSAWTTPLHGMSWCVVLLAQSFFQIFKI